MAIMSKTLRYMMGSILLLLLLMTQVSSAQDSAPSSDIGVSDKNIVYDITGLAKIRRAGWNPNAEFQPLSIADEVEDNDVIFPLASAKVTILCADGKLVQVVAVMGTPPCAPLATDGIDPLPDPPVRGSVDVALLIAPSGKTLSDKPGFRWVKVKNAAKYRVIVSQNGTLVWKKDHIVPATNMTYPEDESPLAPGDYAVRIDALNANDRQLSFDAHVTAITIVSDKDAKALQNSIKKPITKPAREDMLTYQTARIYAKNGFYADAILTLESALKISIADGTGFVHDKDKPNSLRAGALPYILLGNWYSYLSLPDFAEKAYENALVVAQQFHQPENAAWASVQLAVVLTDLRMKYCGFANASTFFTSVFDDGSFLEQVREQMANTVSALGYEPTCAA